MSKKPTRFTKRAMVLSLLSGTTVFLFQNCGQDVRLTRYNSVPMGTISTEKPTKTYCAQTGTTFGAPVRVSIILDMSLSNIATRFIQSSPDYCGGVPSTSAIPPGSDNAGNRFQAVRDFVAQCGQNPGIKFSVLGFGANTEFGLTEACLSSFQEASGALRSVDYLKSLQTQDATPPACSFDPFNQQMGTSYRAALSCLDQKVSSDSALVATEKPMYYTFFLTDGATTDTAQPGMTVVQEYQNRLVNLKNSVAMKASGFKFTPVLYGVGSGVTDEVAATATLDAMAGALDTTVKTSKLVNFTGSATQWCQSLANQSQVSYQLRKLYAVNINAIASKGALLSDSDSDGLSDDDERSRGWDHLNSRSSGVLDGLCLRAGGDASRCKSLISTCVAAGLGLGLTTCDALLGRSVFGGSLTGVDTDSDDIPDLIEILRRGVPTQNDSSVDSDGDFISNFEEIVRGSDHSASDIQWPTTAEKMMVSRIDEQTTAECGAKRAYRYVLNNVPLVPVGAYNDAVKSGADLSHGAGENVILVISIWEGIGAGVIPYRLTVEKILVPSAGAPTYGDVNFIGEYRP